MKLLIRIMIILMISTYSMAAERKPLSEVDTDDLSSDTQAIPKGAGDDHASLVWWMPIEFWEAILSRDTSTSDTDRKAMLDTMSGVSLLAVVQADISVFGAFRFYSKEEIEKNMTLSFTDADGKKHSLSPMQTINPDLEVVLGVFKPILGAAMGRFGNNMHFYVLHDNSKTSSRLLDPYQKGQINIRLARRNNVLMNASIDMPINALYVPRKCPNGKDAHVSWNYCPWSGKKLDK